jgi:hypothetical protein
MEISLLSLDFPDTPPVSELDFRGAFPNDERQPGAQPPAPSADGTAGAAANPVVQNSPTSVSYPVIQYVLPQSTIGSTPSAWLTVYGENLIPDSQVRLNGHAPYTAEIKATEGVEPYKWSLAAGSPAWASIDEKTGTLTGTPDAAGDVAITVKVEDASEVSAEKAYTLSVT